MRLLTFIRRISYLLIAIALSYYLLFFTTSGLKTLLYVIECFVPGQLQIANVTGSLASEINLNQIHYQTKQANVTIERIKLRLTVLSLWEGKISLDQTDVAHVNMQIKSLPRKHTKDASFSADSFAWLEKIMVQSIKLNDVVIIKNDEKPFILNHLNIDRVAHNQYVYTIHSGMGEVEGKLNIDWLTTKTWDLNLIAKNVDPVFFARDLHGKINLTLQSQGEWSANKHSATFALSQLTGTFQNYPVSGLISANYQNGAIYIEQLRAQIADAEINLKGSLQKTWDMSWHMSVPDIKKLYPLASGEINSDGQITGSMKQPNITAKMTADKINVDKVKIGHVYADISSHLKNNTLALQIKSNDIAFSDYQIPQLQLTLNSKLLKQQLHTQIKLALNDKNQALGELFIAPFTGFADFSQNVNGNIDFNFQKLDDLIQLPQVKKLAGILNGTVRMSGKINAPQFAIDANLINGSAYVPALKASINDVSLQANYQLNKAVAFQGNFAIGKGKGSVNGSIKLDTDALQASVNLHGENLEIVNLPEYKMIATPNLTIDYNQNETNIQGKIDIPYAKITPKDFTEVTTLPDEVVFVNQQQNKKETAMPNTLAFNIQLNLGNQVYIAYKNLRSELQGNLTIAQKAGMPATALGELSTKNGKYKAYGRSLIIKEGRIFYTGNLLTNPGIDIRAIQKLKRGAFAESKSQFNDNSKLNSVYTGSETLTVGIIVRGTLDKPNVSFFSDPPGLDQNDILSYLVFGYPRSEIKNVGGLQLLNTIAMGVTSGGSGPSIGGVTKKVKKILKLTDISFGSTEVFNEKENKMENKSTVTIGKKLSKKFSVKYSMGLFNSVSVLSLKYQINKRLAIQSETSSNDTGADLLYEIERD